MGGKASINDPNISKFKAWWKYQNSCRMICHFNMQLLGSINLIEMIPVFAANRTSGLGVILWWKAGCMAPVTTVGVPNGDSLLSMSEVRLVTRTKKAPNQAEQKEFC